MRGALRKGHLSFVIFLGGLRFEQSIVDRQLLSE